MRGVHQDLRIFLARLGNCDKKISPAITPREKRALMAERLFHVAVTVLLVAQSICTAFQVTIPFLKEE